MDPLVRLHDTCAGGTMPDWAIDSSWRWRSADGHRWAPSEMETRHVWFTLRMIWHHTVPPRMYLGRFRRYRFGEFYSDAYFRTAIQQLYMELLVRDDMKPEWRRELALLESHLQAFAMEVSS